MEIQDTGSRVRGLRLIDAYSNRREDGLDEIVDAVALLEDAEDLDDTGAAIFLLLKDVLGAHEYLENEAWVRSGMPEDDDALPGALCSEQLAKESVAWGLTRRIEDSFNATLRSSMERAKDPE